MDVVLGDFREIEVDHLRELVDVDSTCRDIGRDKDADFSCLEVGERAGASILAFISVDGSGTDAFFLKEGRELIRSMFGAGKDEDLAPVFTLDKIGERVGLIGLINGADPLCHGLSGGIARAYRDFGRVVDETFCELTDVF